ncbi:hypothetical protein JQ612_27340 [Bradyrhizobium manausense]|nr:hypothetical protein [Bradyrhizobium manausense]
MGAALRSRGQRGNELTIVETTNYFAKDGQAPVVLQQRRRATAIRRALGLEPGDIFVLREGNGPDVRWECRFPSREAYEADLAVRGGSEAFAEARRTMHTLLERFERHVYEMDDGR